MPFVCPNDPEHDRFTAEVRIAQEWEITKQGALIRVTDSGPDGDIELADWYGDVHCDICGEDAEETDDEQEEDGSDYETD